MIATSGQSGDKNPSSDKMHTDLCAAENVSEIGYNAPNNHKSTSSDTSAMVNNVSVFTPLSTPPTTTMPSSLRADAEKFIERVMAEYDPSHDIHHVNRVRRMALRLAATHPYGRQCDELVVELGALFHDLVDHKYYTSPDQGRVGELQKLLERHGVSSSQSDAVIRIVESVGVTKEKKLRASGDWTEWHETSPEFHCVQDADRLDAIGAMGVFRVAAYSCHANRPLYHPDPAEDTAYRHFFDKLLHLKQTMRTETGRRVAERRHQIMENVVAAARREYMLEDFD